MELREAFTQALDSVHRSTESSELLESVGGEPVQTLQAKLQDVQTALRIVDEQCGMAGTQLASASCSIATHCLSFATADESSCAEAEKADGDAGWGFGTAVAAVIANGLAVAVLGLCLQGDPDKAKEQLPWLSLDLDRISPYLFGGLVHLDAELMLLGETEDLMRSFQAICAWVLLALGFSAGGYAQLPKGLLWAWTDGDAVWTFLLAKGVLSLRAGRDDLADAAVQTPRDLPMLRAAVLQAVLQLPSTSIAFPADMESGDAGDMPMAQRSEALVRHRCGLAEAAVRCDILCTLVWATLQEASDVGSKLAAFLVDLLQADLICGEPEWAAASSSAHEAAESARRAGTKVAFNLGRHSRTLWEGLSLVPGAHRPEALFGELPHGFLQNCASLACYCPAQEEALQGFLSACLKCRSPAGVLVEDDGTALAALCILAANSEAVPARMSVLASTLVGLTVSAQEAILDYWERWKGPLRSEELLQNWAAVFQATLRRRLQDPDPEHPAGEVTAGIPGTTTTAAAPPSVPPVPGGRKALQALLPQAPPDFCCALDGQLMWDPVQSPHGHVFERSSIASVLTLGRSCPLTGLPMELNDCSRLPELRRRIGQWVRSQHPRTGRT